MNLVKISATVHRLIIGASAIVTAVVAGVTALDPGALGIDADVKVTALAVLNIAAAFVNMLRAQTDPQTT